MDGAGREAVVLCFRNRWRVTAGRGTCAVAERVRSFCAAALFGSICLSAVPALAIDGTWTGTTNNDWNTDTNWSPGPTPNNIASFANNGAPTTVSIGGLNSINTIQFTSVAPALSFTFHGVRPHVATINSVRSTYKPS